METRIEWKGAEYLLVVEQKQLWKQMPNPVDQAENNPHATPNPGINIGNAKVVL